MDEEEEEEGTIVKELESVAGDGEDAKEDVGRARDGATAMVEDCAEEEEEELVGPK